MDNKLILTSNRFWDSVTEHCASSVNISTDLDKSAFMSGPGQWTLGTDNINDPDRCIKRLSDYDYPGVWMSEYAEHLGYGLDSYNCISEYILANGGDTGDETVMPSLPTGSGNQLIRYGDLENDVDYTIFTPTFSNNYILSKTGIGTNTISGYVTVTMSFNSPDYGAENQFYYESFKYEGSGTQTLTKKKKYLLMAEANGLDSVNSLNVLVSVSHTSANTVAGVTGIIGSLTSTSTNFTKIYSGKTSTTFILTKEMYTDDIKNWFNRSSIASQFTMGIVSANTGTALTQKYVADLNSQWMTGSTNPVSSTYYSFQSGKNKGVDKSIDLMYIRLSGYSSFSFYIRSNGENLYDYVVVSKLNTSINSATTYNSSSVYAHTYSASTTGTSLSNYKFVNFTGLSTTSAYTIQVGYRKDTSTSQSADTGYVLLPKTNGSYINMYSGGGGGNTGVTLSTIYFSDMFITTQTGVRIYLDEQYMSAGTNFSATIYDSFLDSVINVNCQSGIDSNGGYIKIPKITTSRLLNTNCYLGVLFYYKGTEGYSPINFILPIRIGSTGLVSSDFADCYIFNTAKYMQFQYVGYTSNVSFDVYGITYNTHIMNPCTSNAYAQVTFCSHYDILETTRYQNQQFKLRHTYYSSTSYEQPFYPDGEDEISIIPNEVTNIKQLYNWHHTYVYRGSYTLICKIGQ